MIEYIKGELTELTPAMATVEAAGVGYGLNITLTTSSACQKYLSHPGSAAKERDQELQAYSKRRI